MSNTLAGAGNSTLLSTMGGHMGPVAAFKIDHTKMIPKKSGIERREGYMQSIENLLAHKRSSSVKPKFDGDPKKRSIVPLNLNDIGNWDNMDLMGSLRSVKDVVKDGAETASIHSGAKHL